METLNLSQYTFLPQALRTNSIFIFVRPQFLGNIGSIARVLKNFGFSELRLVDPPANYKNKEAKYMAVSAYDLLESCTVYATLSDALKDVNVAIGTSSGRQRESAPASLEEVVGKACDLTQTGKVAWIFGEERNGLVIDELDRCHFNVTIPTNPNFPVMNVAQAVGTIAYELSKRLVNSNLPDSNQDLTGSSGQSSPNGEEDDELFLHIGELIDVAGFSRSYNRAQTIAELRQVYQRMIPSKREWDLLRGIVLTLNKKLR